jgi:ATP-dependent RNA helicase DeaD
MAQDKQPLFAKEKLRKSPERRDEERRKRREQEGRPADDKRRGTAGDAGPRRPDKAEREVPPPDKGMIRYRIEVGYSHGVKPGTIVGAIANEAEIDSEYIGRIEIYDDHATVDLPDGMPKEIYSHLKGVWVSGQRLQISRADSRRAREREGLQTADSEGKSRGKKPGKTKGKPSAKKRPAVAARKKKER